MKLLKYTLSCFLVCVSPSLAWAQGNDIVASDILPLKGFSLTPVPSTKFKPGYVFRYTDDGVQYEAASMNFDQSCEESTQIPNWKHVSKANGSALAKFMKYKPLKVGVDAEIEQIFDISLSMDDPCYVSASDAEFLAEKKRIEKDLINIMKEPAYLGHTLYVVREAFATKKMDLKINKSDQFVAGLMAKLSKFFDFQIGGGMSDADNIDLSINGSKNLFVLMKLEKLYFEAGAHGGLTLNSSPVDEYIVFQ